MQRLKLEGARVNWYRSKRDAVRGLLDETPHLVICDIRLADGTGEEVFRDTRRGGSDPAFLFMTAFADIDQAVRLMKAGAEDYIAKPFEMSKLLARVLGVLGEQRAHAARSGDLRFVRGEAEKALIEKTVADTRWKIGEAARRLNVSRTTLWSRMKQLGIERPRPVQKTERRN